MRPIFLIGFMASGKSSVGAALAHQLSRPFVDLDAMIEAQAGAAIPMIFEREGEAGFRRREAAALSQALQQRTAVVATGGGAPCFGDNLERMLNTGTVIHLSTDLATVLARASDPTTRPLLDRPAEEVAGLHRERQQHYRRAHATVSGEAGDPVDTARSIAAMMTALDRFPPSVLEHCSILALGSRSYPILVEDGCPTRLGELVAAAVPGCTRVGIVSDQNVAPLYADAVAGALDGAGLAALRVEVPAGEAAKSFDVFAQVTGELIAGGLDRRSAIAALGGGVVGDLAGFVAASLYRGMAVVQVPTTVLAMIDSSIGGKTGINTPHGKNLVGAFWQPSVVVADPATLTSLSARERRAACGELIKYGLLDGEELYHQVDAIVPRLAEEALVVDEETVAVIRRCAAIKAAIVSADEREAGLRAILNLGHTIGHAIEAATGYGRILHGEAVGLGLVAACRVSRHLGLTGAALEQRVVETVRRAQLDANFDRWRTDEVIGRVSVDKKRTGSRIRFVTVAAPGDVGLVDIDVEQVGKLLAP